MSSRGAVYVVSFPHKRCVVILTTNYLLKKNQIALTYDSEFSQGQGDLTVFQSCYMSHTESALIKKSHLKKHILVSSSTFGPMRLFLSLPFSLASRATVERTSIIRDYHFNLLIKRYLTYRSPRGLRISSEYNIGGADFALKTGVYN